jgi:hypothetical protein
MGIQVKCKKHAVLGVGGFEPFPGETHSQDYGIGNKNSVPKSETHKTIDASSTILLNSPLIIV